MTRVIKMLNRSQVLRATKIERDDFWKKIDNGKFPEPSGLKPNGRSLWYEYQVLEWINKQRK